jgi:hypothetical protein
MAKVSQMLVWPGLILSLYYANLQQQLVRVVNTE